MEPDSLPLLVLGAAVTVADEVDLSDAVSERLQAKIQEMVDLKVCACVCGGGLDRERGWSASSWGGHEGRREIVKSRGRGGGGRWEDEKGNA